MILLLIYIIILLYFIYFIWLIEPFFKKKRRDVNNASDYPFVSILISAKNEEKNLDLLIDSLLNQKYPKNCYEIIIANDKSTDSTLNKLNNFKKKYNQILIVDIQSTPKNWGSKKWALNKCIEISNGDIILQTDADCRHKKNWITSMMQPFKNPQIGFVCGPSYIGTESNFWNQILKLESIAQESFTYANSKREFYLSCTARNIAFRKHIFNEIDGYKDIEYIESGDDDLLLHKFVMQTDSKIQYLANEKTLVSSQAPKSIKSFYLQRLRYASKGLLYYKLNTPLEVKIILPILFISNFACIVSILNFINYQNFMWLIPLIIKGLADIILINQYMHRIKINFRLLYFIILMIIHPFYVVIIGGLAPIIKVQWK